MHDAMSGYTEYFSNGNAVTTYPGRVRFAWFPCCDYRRVWHWLEPYFASGNQIGHGSVWDRDARHVYVIAWRASF